MIIVAIDEINFKKASNIIDNLDSEKCMIKIGSVAFNSIGHEIISHASKKGFEIFLDLKLHDIPNTVKKSIEGLVSYPIKMLTIHISGGKEMMTAAMEAVAGTGIKIFGVTALTSLSDDDTIEIFQRTTSEHVDAMLDLAQSAGIDGIVCSPQESKMIRKKFQNLLIITPGIRLPGDNSNDQVRVMTPKDAFRNKVSGVVIGRSLTKGNIKHNVKKLIDHLSK